MNSNDPNATQPRTPSEPVPLSEDTKPRLVSDGTSDTNRTADHVAGDSPSPTGTVARTPSDVARLEEAAVATAAEGVPGYVILGELGRGGMGVVHKARHVKLNRVVALKMMLGGEPASRNDTFRFLAEAEAVAAIKHENVVQVFDYGEADGRPFMALEFCAGGTLTKLLPCNAAHVTAPRVMAALVAKVARGVAAAHALGIVHRDLKPGNVFLDDARVPKVADFGLAKRGAGADVTRVGVGMGTPAYMAPEQARDAKFVGPQADVWALGVILYEALTGGRPFTGTVQEIMAKAQNVEPVAPRKVVGSVPLDVELICLKCLSKLPHERYATAKELADDLDRFARGEAISVRPLGVSERVVRWVRRKPTLAAAWGFSSLAVVLALVVFVVFGLYREAEDAKGKLEIANGQLAGEKKSTEDARDEALKQKGIAVQAEAKAVGLQGVAERVSEKLEVFDYGKTVQLACQEWRNNNIVRARSLLEGTTRELRGWEWHYVHRLCHASLLTLTGHTDYVQSAAFSADGARVVTSSHDKTAKVWDARTGTELLTLKRHTDKVQSASFSADGSRVVTASEDKTARIWDARTGAELFVLKGHTGRVLAAAFSADGSRVVTGDEYGLAKVWDAKTGAELLISKGQAVRFVAFSADGSRAVATPRDAPASIWDTKAGGELFALKGHTGDVSSAAFSPNGSRVVTGGADKTARIWDAKTGAELFALRGHTERVYSTAFSADGSRIVTGGADKTARIWDAKTGTELLTLKGHAYGAMSASFSADGSRVVTVGGYDKTAKVWDAKRGSELLALKGPTGVRFVAFSADGSRAVATGNATAHIWDTKTGAELFALRGHKIGLRLASFSADGSRVVTGSYDTTAKVWDAKSGAELLTLKGHAISVESVSFSADGSRVVTGGGDRTARIWDAKTGAELLAIKGLSGVGSASFSADGSRVVTGGPDGTVKVWDAKTGGELFALKGHKGGVPSVALSADGSRIVTKDADGAKVWDGKSGAELFALKGHAGRVYSVAFSPDGSWVVTAGEDGTAKVWDAKIGIELLTLQGHVGEVGSAAFSAGGSRIVTGGADGTAKVWDTKTGAELLTLQGHTGGGRSVSFSADGSRVVTLGGDGTAYIYDPTPLDPQFLPRPVAPAPRPVNR